MPNGSKYKQFQFEYWVCIHAPIVEIFHQVNKKANHLNNKQVKVRNLDVSTIQMFAFQIPTSYF